MPDPSNAIAMQNGRIQQDEINCINEELMEINERRVALLRKLNSLQASTKILPPETLSLIIELYHDAEKKETKPSLATLKLGHVSSDWRQIVWSTPQLWSDLAIEVDERNIHIVAPLLQLHLRNVGDLPLTVDLAFDFRLCSHWAEESFDLIASVLFHEVDAAKIETLCLVGAPLQWSTQFNTSNLSSLKRLDLGEFQERCEDSDVIDLDLAEMPCLHDVALTVLDDPIVTKLCWSKITILKLWAIPIVASVELLTNCPNLVVFRCLDLTGSYDNISTTPNRSQDIITLNYLEIFEWTHHPSCLGVFRLLRFPALRELLWNCPLRYDSREEELAVHTLISNLPPTLSSLKLRRLMWTISFLKGVFEQTEHVEYLSVDSSDNSAIVNMFPALTEDVDAGGHRMLLPFLKKVVITPWGDFKSEFERNYSLLILRFLQYRFRKGCFKFCMQITRFSMLDWPLEVREELCRMRKAGFELEVYDESGKLDWLEAAGGLTT